MTCRKVVPLIDDFADGSLDENLSEKIQKHICSCSKCESKLDDTHRLKTLLGRAPIPEPDGQYFRHATGLILTRISKESEFQRRIH